MKKISTIIALCCAVALLALPQAMRAQTIILDSVSATQFCAGDPISVTFTVTGAWGTNPMNAFTLQLSNDSGNFDIGFQNIGSISDTAAGTFTIYTTAPYGLVYQKYSATRSIDSGQAVRDFDSVIVTYSQGDTVYDTVQRAHLVWIYDTTYNTVPGTHYRVRVMGGNPRIASMDNGTDIVIGPYPGYWVWSNDTAWQHGFTNTGVGLLTSFYPIFVSDHSALGANDSFYWTFGDGANPATTSIIPARNVWQTTYSTPGLKMVTVTSTSQGGCSSSDTTYAYVFDCTAPVIPNDAIVISNDTDLSYWNDSSYAFISLDSHGNLDTTIEVVQTPSRTHPRTFWINPGVTVTANMSSNDWPISEDTIFAESDANISGGMGNIIYLKPGTTVSRVDEDAIIIYGDTVSVDAWTTQHNQTLHCSGLTFDYTTAPPNSIMHINDGPAGVAIANTALDQIALSPNPTNGVVAVQGVPVSAQVQVMNVLGVAVQEMARTIASDFTLDLSTLAAGTYYVRITSGGGVTTKKVVKE